MTVLTFCLGMPIFLSSCMSRPESPGLFAQADLNRDGFVSQNEWQQYGGNDVSFMAADHDHAGKLSESEFYEAVRLNQQSQGNSQAQQKMNDGQTSQLVRAALSSSGDINGYAIKVDTYNGVVTLSGTVRTQKEKQRAEEIASGVQGVGQVFNSIAVKY